MPQGVFADISKKAHFAYSDPVNLDTSRLAQSLRNIRITGKTLFLFCIRIKKRNTDKWS